MKSTSKPLLTPITITSQEDCSLKLNESQDDYYLINELASKLHKSEFFRDNTKCSEFDEENLEERLEIENKLLFDQINGDEKKVKYSGNECYTNLSCSFSDKSTTSENTDDDYNYLCNNVNQHRNNTDSNYSNKDNLLGNKRVLN